MRSLRRSIRPLTPDMRRYAREDTHFLLFISDQLRSILLQQEEGAQLVGGRGCGEGSCGRS